MKRAFTLVEILVVVSIISMLSSVVIATITPARARARDTARIQQIRQLDLAIQLYKANTGHAPDLSAGCKIQQQAMQHDQAVSACVAISTQGVAGDTPWSRLKSDLAPYISSLPSDPCGANCTSTSGYPVGYTYVAPAAMQYFCQSDCVADDSSYQVYAALETTSSLSGGGSSSSSGTYYPPVADTLSPSVPTNVTATLVGSWPSLTVSVSWTPSTDTGGSGLQGYKVEHIDLEGYQDQYGNPIPPNPAIPRTQNIPLFWQGYHICYTVVAYDNQGNASAASAALPASCIDVPYYFALSPPTNFSATLAGPNTNFSWQYAYGQNPYFPIYFSLYKDGVFNSNYTVYSAESPVSYSRFWGSPACWQIRVSDSDYDAGPNGSDLSPQVCTH
jgi:prepilin-type N-terminal cleavage/methylation domain-containing protein